MGAGCVQKELIYKLVIMCNYAFQALKVLFGLQKVPSEINDIWQWDSFIRIELLQGQIALLNKIPVSKCLINRLKNLIVRMLLYLSFLVFISQSNAKPRFI